MREKFLENTDSGSLENLNTLNTFYILPTSIPEAPFFRTLKLILSQFLLKPNGILEQQILLYHINLFPYYYFYICSLEYYYQRTGTVSSLLDLSHLA